MESRANPFSSLLQPALLLLFSNKVEGADIHSGIQDIIFDFSLPNTRETLLIFIDYWHFIDSSL